MIREFWKTPLSEIDDLKAIANIEEFKALELGTVFFLKTDSLTQDGADSRGGTPVVSIFTKEEKHLDQKLLDHINDMMLGQKWQGKFIFTFYTKPESEEQYLARK
jgi:hypothetical protein